jgi:preprotein translocase subunit YajC
MIEILAQDAAGGSGGPLSFLILLVPLALLFLLMRGQRKRMAEQQAIQRSVAAGDEVLTTSGIFGRVVDVEDDDTLWVEIAPGTRVRMVRGGIARRLAEESEGEGEATGSA